MLDRYYTRDELRREIKRALRPDNILDMSEEQRKEFYKELDAKERGRRHDKSRQNTSAHSN